LRQVSKISSECDGRLFLSMPAFAVDHFGVVKIATVFPDNSARGWPTVQAAIVVFSERGTPIAVLDGTEVTRYRTGAASALASRYLFREDSSELVMIGTGALAPKMVAAHCAVRAIVRVRVWGRRPERATAAVEAIENLVPRYIRVEYAPDLEVAVRSADIVSCATSSALPVLAGRWLRPGTFVDLVGSFSPSTREADDEVMSRSRLFVDTLEGAFAEAGDILDPLSRGVIERTQIEAELADLVRGNAHGRGSPREIIVFKSVGTAIEDLAAARMLLKSCKHGYPDA
jgi:ornithine cyclodeaminase